LRMAAAWMLDEKCDSFARVLAAIPSPTRARGGGGFRRWRPLELSDELLPPDTSVASNRGQLTQKLSVSASSSARGDAADTCALQMKWPQPPLQREASMEAFLPPASPWHRTVDIGPMPQKAPLKDGKPAVMSVSQMDWAKLDAKPEARKAQQMTVFAGDLQRCNGDLQSLRLCQLSARPQGETFVSAFERRCRAKGPIRDPWKGLPNPEKARIPTVLDRTVNQLWVPSPTPVAKAPRKTGNPSRPASGHAASGHAAGLATPPQTTPPLGANRRHSWGGGNLSRPASGHAASGHASDHANPSQSTPPQRTPPLGANRRHSWGGDSLKCPISSASTCSTRPSVTSSNTFYGSPLQPSASSSTKLPGRRHSFGPESSCPRPAMESTRPSSAACPTRQTSSQSCSTRPSSAMCSPDASSTTSPVSEHTGEELLALTQSASAAELHLLGLALQRSSAPSDHTGEADESSPLSGSLRPGTAGRRRSFGPSASETTAGVEECSAPSGPSRRPTRRHSFGSCTAEHSHEAEESSTRSSQQPSPAGRRRSFGPGMVDAPSPASGPGLRPGTAGRRRSFGPSASEPAASVEDCLARSGPSRRPGTAGRRHSVGSCAAEHSHEAEETPPRPARRVSTAGRRRSFGPGDCRAPAGLEYERSFPRWHECSWQLKANEVER